MVVNRESLEDGIIVEIAQEAERLGLFTAMTDAQREESLERTLQEAGDGQDLWLFGYGSLMWNPAILYEESRPARLHGWHRRFCLWTPVGRGTPENPGLVLGLDRGGACPGFAFRVAAEHVRSEFRLVWRREMVTNAYMPRLVSLRSEQGRFQAVTFVINRDHERYAGKLDSATQIRHLATARGRLGPCREYLLNTADHLREQGVRDRNIEYLARRVREIPEDSSGNI